MVFRHVYIFGLRGFRVSSYFFGIFDILLQLFYMFVQSAINLQDFRDAEPDILVHSIPDIIAHLGDSTIDCNLALKSLCKKNGFHVEVLTFYMSIMISILLVFCFVTKLNT